MNYVYLRQKGTENDTHYASTCKTRHLLQSIRYRPSLRSTQVICQTLLSAFLNQLFPVPLKESKSPVGSALIKFLLSVDCVRSVYFHPDRG
jgi:hypothetical protein